MLVTTIGQDVGQPSASSLCLLPFKDFERMVQATCTARQGGPNKRLRFRAGDVSLHNTKRSNGKSSRSRTPRGLTTEYSTPDDHSSNKFDTSPLYVGINRSRKWCVSLVYNRSRQPLASTVSRHCVAFNGSTTNPRSVSDANTQACQ